jgi:hypothetical protein
MNVMIGQCLEFNQCAPWWTLDLKPPLSQPQPWAHDQGKGLQGCGLKERPGSHITCSRECQRMWGHEPSHSQVNSHVGNWSPKWTLKFSECNYMGQNPSIQRFIYIIGKLLTFKCLKWARITHLNIWNTSYCQMKDQ